MRNIYLIAISVIISVTLGYILIMPLIPHNIFGQSNLDTWLTNMGLANSSRIYVQTASAFTSTTLLSMIGTGVGTTTIASSSMVAGNSFSFEWWGFYQTTSTAGTMNPAVYLGTTLLASTTQSYTTSMSNRQWYAWGVITYRTLGDNGTVFTQGQFCPSTNATASNCLELSNTAVTNVSTTIDRNFDFKLRFLTGLSNSSAATSTNGVLLRN